MKLFQNVSVKYNVFVKEMRKELEPLIRDREKIVAELKRLQRENDQLVSFCRMIIRLIYYLVQNIKESITFDTIILIREVSLFWLTLSKILVSY